jgi:hypothetical protein
MILRKGRPGWAVPFAFRGRARSAEERVCEAVS